jgi:chromosome segregation ATPase
MKTNRKLAKAKKNAEVTADLAVLRAELKVTRGYLVISGRRIGVLEAEVAALEAKRDELGAEVDKSNDMARTKTREVWALRKDLHATENKLAEMEEELQEFQDEVACSANKTAFRKAQADADADYEEDTGECANAGRQHPHEVREAAMKYLALGIAPSRVSSCMRIGKFNFTGPQPKLRWVQHMRSELRVAVCMLAAASAADPEVELLS